jgi:hypothetical protein
VLKELDEIQAHLDKARPVLFTDKVIMPRSDVETLLRAVRALLAIPQCTHSSGSYWNGYHDALLEMELAMRRALAPRCDTEDE